jgi:type I restriction enzyme, S subunit
VLVRVPLSATADLLVDGDWVESKDQDPSGEVRLIQLTDIGVGKFLNRSARFLTSTTARRLRCTYLRPGDLLIARMPDPIGRACIFPDMGTPCVTAVDVAILRPKDYVDADYLMSWNTGPLFLAWAHGFQ